MGRIKEIDRKRVRHEKVRSGCDQCKKRRIKCPEGEPCRRCVIARLDCTYTAAIKESDDGSRGKSHGPKRIPNPSAEFKSTVDGQQWTDFWLEPDAPDSTWPELHHVTRPLGDPSQKQWTTEWWNASSALYKTPNDTLFTGELETSGRGFQRYWLENYTAPRSVLALPVWMERIHQRAYHFPPLRDLIIAMGSIGLSLARGDDASTHLRVLQKTQKYVEAAVLGLSTAQLPTSVMLYCAWIFWQLDLIRGNLATSYLHVMSARKIAAEAPLGGEIDEIEIKGLFGIDEPDWGIDMSMAPDAFLPANSAAKRKERALPLIRGTWTDISTMILDVNADVTIPAEGGTKEMVLKVLEDARSDLEWLLRKWTNDLAATKRDQMPFWLDFGPLEDSPSLSATSARPKFIQKGAYMLNTENSPSLSGTAWTPPEALQAGAYPYVLNPTAIASPGSALAESDYPPIPPLDELSEWHIFSPRSGSRASSSDINTPRPSFCSLFHRALKIARDDELSGKAIATFRIHCLQFVPQLVVLVAQTDLGMRHDEFLLLSRNNADIRQRVSFASEEPGLALRSSGEFF